VWKVLASGHEGRAHSANRLLAVQLSDRVLAIRRRKLVGKFQVLHRLAESHEPLEAVTLPSFRRNPALLFENGALLVNDIAL
jgi:hypothetical protein